MDTKKLKHLVENQHLYVVQEASQHIGNDLLFWKEGKAGYTTDLGKAHLFTLKEANLLHHDRATDVPHRLGDLLEAMSVTVDIQELTRVANQPVATPDANSRMLQTLSDKRAVIEANRTAEEPPIVWAYEMDGSMEPAVVTITRWKSVPEGWNETDLTELMADPSNRPTSENLHQWAAALNKAGSLMPTAEAANEMYVAAQEVERATLYAQANELLAKTGHSGLKTQAEQRNAAQPDNTYTMPSVIIQEALIETLEAADTKVDDILVVSSKQSPELIEAVLINPDRDQERFYQLHKDMNRSRMSMAEFAATLWKHPNLHEAIGYHTWTKLAEFIKPHLSEVFLDDPTASGLEATTPTDLPPIIALNRLALLDTFAKPENLQAKIELTEIVIANLYGEPVNTDVFSEASLSKSDWHTLTANRGIEEFREARRALADAIEQEQTIAGDTPAEEKRFKLATMRTELSELDHLTEMGEHHASRKTRQKSPQNGDDMDLDAGYEPSA